MRKMKKAFSAKDIARRVEALGAELRKDAGDSEIFLLGVLRGTTCFVADLLRALPGSVTYGFINVVRDVADTEVPTVVDFTGDRAEALGDPARQPRGRRNVHVIRLRKRVGVELKLRIRRV